MPLREFQNRFIAQNRTPRLERIPYDCYVAGS
jgi:hypothetical protein